MRERSRPWLVAVAALVVGVALAGLAGCGKEADPWEGLDGSPRVAVSFPPLYCFARNVAGPDVPILSLLENKGPHGYEYESRDLLVARRVDLFLVGGLGLDDRFTDPIFNNCANPKLKRGRADAAPADGLAVRPGETYVRVSDNLRFLDPGLILPTPAHEEQHGKGCPCQHGPNDPHTWLGIPQAIGMVRVIRDALIEADPKGAEGYRQRAADYTKKLEKLQADGKEMLRSKKERRLLSFHDSLRYFCKSFDLDDPRAITVEGDEPSLAELGELLALCLDPKAPIRVIAVEPQFPQMTAARTLLDELRKKDEARDARFVEVDTLETAVDAQHEGEAVPYQDPRWYELKMRQNLRNLAETLK
jgi:ABC-type Zn uptake system ZnuABC Zn-binding protein ZnuA